MRITYQLIENYLTQEVPTIVFTIQNQKYIFNIPESFQRFTKEHRYRFPKASNMFFTRANSSTVAGLKGLMLTLYQGGNAWDTRLYVNNQLYQYLQQIRYQMGFKILPYSYLNWTGQCQRGFRNQERITQLLKRKDYATHFHNIDKYFDKIPKPQQNINDCRRSIKNGVFRDQNIEIIPFHIDLKAEKPITNFICIPNKIQGKVLVEKLNQYKVPKKQINKLLKQGELKLTDGTIIYSKDVKQQDVPSPIFIILHLTSLESLFGVVGHQILKSFMENKQNRIESVIHIVEDSKLIESIEYRQFFKMFSEDTNHLIYTKSYKDSEEIPQFFRHFSVVSKLAENFPEYISNIKANQQDFWIKYLASCKHIKQILPFNNINMYKRCYEMVLAPRKNRGYAKLQNQIKKQMDVQYNIEQANQLRKRNKQQNQKLWDFSKIDPKVTFLGTGSMKPSTYRNVSGIHIQWNQQNSFILDCGEGTYYQLLNHVGLANIDKELLKIKVIFITHIHSDHNLGILNLIAQRKKLCDKMGINDQLYLIIPYNMAPWIYGFDEFIDALDVKILFIQTLLGQSYQISGNFSKDERYTNSACFQRPQVVEQTQHYSTPKLSFILSNYFRTQPQLLKQFESYLNSIQVCKFTPVHVIHCPQSFGIVIKHNNGIKISYSGDTRPCPQFIKQAENSTLMIHEATFGDDLQNNAIQNMHATVKEALESGLKSNSWRIALTHFSQRYTRTADILQPHTYKFNYDLYQYSKQNAIVCFDHFQMRLSESQNMPAISKCIMELLPQDKD